MLSKSNTLIFEMFIYHQYKYFSSFKAGKWARLAIPASNEGVYIPELLDGTSFFSCLVFSTVACNFRSSLRDNNTAHNLVQTVKNN